MYKKLRKINSRSYSFICINKLISTFEFVTLACTAFYDVISTDVTLTDNDSRPMRQDKFFSKLCIAVLFI